MHVRNRLTIFQSLYRFEFRRNDWVLTHSRIRLIWSQLSIMIIWLAILSCCPIIQHFKLDIFFIFKQIDINFNFRTFTPVFYWEFSPLVSMLFKWFIVFCRGLIFSLIFISSNHYFTPSYTESIIYHLYAVLFYR